MDFLGPALGISICFTTLSKTNKPHRPTSRLVNTYITKEIYIYLPGEAADIIIISIVTTAAIVAVYLPWNVVVFMNEIAVLPCCLCQL